MQLQLNPQLNRGLIGEIFGRQGRVHVPDLLTPESAAELYSCLSTQTPWQLSLNIGARHLDLAHEQLMLIPPGKRVAGKKRLVAHVLNMTPQWRADWGGILQRMTKSPI